MCSMETGASRDEVGRETRRMLSMRTCDLQGMKVVAMNNAQRCAGRLPSQADPHGVDLEKAAGR